MQIKLFTVHDWWSTTNLTRKTNEFIANKQREGWEFISISINWNHLMLPTSFIAMKKGEQ